MNVVKSYELEEIMKSMQHHDSQESKYYMTVANDAYCS